MTKPRRAVDPTKPGEQANPTQPMSRGGQRRARYWLTQSDLEPVIYGTIVITGVVTAATPEISAGATLALAAGTLVSFFLAHVYAQVLARSIDDQSPRAATAKTAALTSRGMVEALAIPGVALLLGAIGLISDSLAITLAEWLCVGQLFLWCVIVGRLQRGWTRAVAVGLVFAALGAAIVLLKTLLH